MFIVKVSKVKVVNATKKVAQWLKITIMYHFLGTRGKQSIVESKAKNEKN